MTRSSNNATSKPSYTRNVMHGNNVNKHGAAARQGNQTRNFQNTKMINTGEKPQKKKRGPAESDQIIIAPPPQRPAACPEMRFTLPDSPENVDIRISQVRTPL